MTREIRRNAFEMNRIGHQAPGLSAYPRNRSAGGKDLEYWADLARLLERGRFDGVFLASGPGARVRKPPALSPIDTARGAKVIRTLQSL